MTAPALRVLRAGPGVTLQDAGRFGHLRHGITASGPMDRLAHAAANLAAGNAPGATAVEVSLGGLEVAAEGEALGLAYAGGRFRAMLDGRALPETAALTLEPGAVLSLRAGPAGAWCYLAVAGRIEVAPVLGSTATHTRAGLGGLGGRALGEGDRLPVADPRPPAPDAALVLPWLERPGDVIRVVLGPQADHFAPDQIAAFLAGPWTVTARGDRMACFLDGAPLRHLGGHDIVSDGVALGAVQVPGDGRPLVLMADRQPTGGYPKIGTVIGPDLARLAQGRAGATLRFRAVSVDEAVAARRAEAECLARPIARVPLVRTNLTSAFLLGLNLVGGVVNGRATD